MELDNQREQTHSRRVLRAEREIREIIATRLLGGIGLDVPGMLSVTRVAATSDLRSARVFVSVLSFGSAQTGEVDKDEVLEMLNSMTPEFQREIARNLPMRYCPKIRFFLDDSLEKQMKVERVLHEISSKRSPSSEPRSRN